MAHFRVGDDTWNSVAGATGYLVEWRHGLHYSNRANTNRVRTTSTSATLALNASGGGGAVTARVRAYSPSGVSGWVGRTWGSRPPTLKIHDTTMFEADGLAALRVTLDPPRPPAG